MNDAPDYDALTKAANEDVRACEEACREAGREFEAARNDRDREAAASNYSAAEARLVSAVSARTAIWTRAHRAGQ